MNIDIVKLSTSLITMKEWALHPRQPKVFLNGEGNVKVGSPIHPDSKHVDLVVCLCLFTGRANTVGRILTVLKSIQRIAWVAETPSKNGLLSQSMENEPARLIVRFLFVFASDVKKGRKTWYEK